MAHFGKGVEQALHFLLRLGHGADARPVSSADVAEFHNLPAPFTAKLFTKLRNAGIVEAQEGIRGGFRLARPAMQISVLEVADAVEGRKPVFECHNIRAAYCLFRNRPPEWATSGVCAIHQVMIDAEEAMRRQLAGVTLEDIRSRAAGKIPDTFRAESASWFARRRQERGRSKEAAGTGAPREEEA